MVWLGGAAVVRPDNEGVGRATDEVWDGTVDETIQANDGPDERALDNGAGNEATNRAGNRASVKRLDWTRVVALVSVLCC